MRNKQANPAVARHHLSPDDYALDETISQAATWLTSRQQTDGHWVFELEAHASIPSEYILLNHYLSGKSPITSGAIKAFMVVGRCTTTATSISAHP